MRFTPPAPSMPLARESGDAPRNADFSSDSYFSSLDSHVEWEREAIRKSMQENVYVSSDMRTVDHRVTIAAQRPRKTDVVLHVASYFDDTSLPSDDDIGIHDIEGASVANVAIEEVEGGISKLVTLILPPGGAGAMQNVSYSHRFTSQTPPPFLVERAFAWPLLFYSCSVHFAGMLPANPRLEVTAFDGTDEQTAGVEFTRELVFEGDSLTFCLDRPYSMVARVVYDS